MKTGRKKGKEKKKEKGKKRRFKTRGAGETIDRLQSDRKIVGLVLERTEWSPPPIVRGFARRFPDRGIGTSLVYPLHHTRY